MTNTQPKSRWYVELLKRFQDLSERIQLSVEARDELKEFLLAIAKEQYLTGNRSGIRWAREQASAKA